MVSAGNAAVPFYDNIPYLIGCKGFLRVGVVVIMQCFDFQRCKDFFQRARVFACLLTVSMSSSFLRVLPGLPKQKVLARRNRLRPLTANCYCATVPALPGHLILHVPAVRPVTHFAGRCRASWLTFVLHNPAYPLWGMSKFFLTFAK